MLIKKTLFFSMVFLSSFSSSLFAQDEVSYTPAERIAVMNKLPDLVNAEFFKTDSIVSSCWEAAKRGDDTSLYAVYVLAESYPLMVKYQDGMSKAVKYGKSDSQKYDMIKETVMNLNPQRAIYFLNKMPGAVLHCASVSGYDLEDEKAYLSEKIRKELDL